MKVMAEKLFLFKSPGGKKKESGLTILTRFLRNIQTEKKKGVPSGNELKHDITSRSELDRINGIFNISES